VNCDPASSAVSLLPNAVSLNDLPAHLPWPSRLLGLSPWSPSPRDIRHIDREYDKEKYARLLDFFRQSDGTATIEEITQLNHGAAADDRLCVSVAEQLVLMTVAQCRQHYYGLLRDGLAPYMSESRTIVELGCGYGYNLWMLQQHFASPRFLGGEYSANAVQLAGMLFSPDSRVRVAPFNYYDPDSYRFLESAEPPVLVFTSHSIEQLPSAVPFVRNIHLYRSIIRAVVHCEPVYECAGDSLLGLLRRRYTQLNDYNTDLVTELRRQPGVSILSLRPNLFGINPLNATSVIAWEFNSAVGCDH
jgi:hypothetical protein